jgi:hypothetical protein
MEEMRGLFRSAGPIGSSLIEMSRLRTLEGPVEVFILVIMAAEEPCKYF